MAHPDPSTVDGSDDHLDPLDRLAGLRPPPSGGVWDRFDDARHRVVAAPGRSAAILVGALAAAAVGWWFLRPPAAPLEGAVPLATSAGSSAGSAGASPPSTATSVPAGTSTSTTEGSLVVQAAGAVARGGVFRLPPGSRVDDLIRAAGGLATDADADRVNLAAPLSDGERVWVPRRGETSAPEVVAGAGGGGGGGAPAGGSSGGGGSTGDGASGPPAIVNLNTATATELDTLPGVGPATASAILAYRSEHGSFASVDDLLEVRGIGDAKLEQLRASVTV